MADFLSSKGLEEIKIGGVALASILAVIVTVSIVRTNLLTAKYMKASLKELASKGFTDDSFIDNLFEKIQSLATGQPNQ